MLLRKVNSKVQILNDKQDWSKYQNTIQLLLLLCEKVYHWSKVRMFGNNMRMEEHQYPPGGGGAGGVAGINRPSNADFTGYNGTMYGLTLKEILETRDLFNVTVEDDKDDKEMKKEKVLVGTKQAQQLFKVRKLTYTKINATAILKQLSTCYILLRTYKKGYWLKHFLSFCGPPSCADLWCHGLRHCNLAISWLCPWSKLVSRKFLQ